MSLNFKDIWGKRVLCFDGAMGTMIQEMGLKIETAPEYLNLSHPEKIRAIHKAYIEAGADIIETNTFGANKIKLSNFGLEKYVDRINQKAVGIAKEVAQDKALVAASMGPTGKFLEPIGDLSFSSAVKVFKEQALALKKAGADIFVVETMSDIKEAKAAVIGIKEVADLPIFVLATFQEDFFTLLGVSPEAAGITLEALDVKAIGANCSLGPEGIFEVAKRMASVTQKPLVFMPNAGLPQLINGKTFYPCTPEKMGEFAVEFTELGAWAVGGCCGSKPEHIKEIAKRVKKLPVVKRAKKDELKLSGKRDVVFIGGKNPPVIIGERINPTGKKEFQKELRKAKVSWAIKAAVSQVKEGAKLLDVNVGMAEIDEKKILPLVVEAIQTQVGVPLVLDSSNPEALEAALQIIDGKALINSVSGEKKSKESILPLAKKYAAAVLVLPIDEKGVPNEPEERVKIAEKIIEEAAEIGIPKNDIIVDGIVTAISADEMAPYRCLETVKLIKEQLKTPVVLGISNISFGLPARDVINAAFLSTALFAGADAVIVNPENKKIKDFFYAGLLLAGKDAKAQIFIKTFGEKKEDVKEEKALKPDEALFQAVILGDETEAKNWTKRLLEKKDPLAISNEILIPAIEEVGRKFEKGEYFLPQVMASAQAMKSAFELIKKKLKGKQGKKATILMATVEGDVHDIGKNIVCTLLENHGFEVIDLGKNVPAQRVIEEAKKHKAQIVGLSALMTTTMTQMEKVVKMLKEQNLKVIPIVGGAVVTPEYAKSIGAFYAKDAIDAVRVLENILKNKEVDRDYPKG